MKEKLMRFEMLQGEHYKAWDPELLKERDNARQQKLTFFYFHKNSVG
jgi:hypothetical protein